MAISTTKDSIYKTLAVLPVDIWSNFANLLSTPFGKILTFLSEVVSFWDKKIATNAE